MAAPPFLHLFIEQPVPLLALMVRRVLYLSISAFSSTFSFWITGNAKVVEKIQGEENPLARQDWRKPILPCHLNPYLTLSYHWINIWPNRCVNRN
jgi:hypothetical protein